MTYDKAYYKNLIDAFRPDELHAVVIAESPPASGKFFYDPQGAAAEILFATLMLAFLDSEYPAKQTGLRAFQQAGYLLLDATYTPVNKLPDERRKATILGDFPLLLSDLEGYGVNKKTPIILMKKNVCELLQPKFRTEGYNIIGCVDYPYWQTEPNNHKVAKQIQAILKQENLSPASNNKEFENAVRQLLENAKHDIAKFLGETLPQIEPDWWQKCVLESLSEIQKETLKNAGHTTLDNLDLSALLQILSPHWKRIAKQRNLRRQHQIYIDELKVVRNRWAHLSSKGLEYDDIRRDLDTLKRVVEMLNPHSALLSKIADCNNKFGHTGF